MEKSISHSSTDVYLARYLVLYTISIKPEEILAHMATKHDARPDAADVKKEMERQRNWLLDALVKKGLALCKLNRADPDATEVIQELARFTDPMSDTKAHLFVCTHAQEVGHYGRALKCALAHLDSKPGSVDMEHREASFEITK